MPNVPDGGEQDHKINLKGRKVVISRHRRSPGAELR